MDSSQVLETGFCEVRLGRLSAALHADVKAGAIAGAVVSISNRRNCVYAECFGFADLTAARPMRRDSLFRIASLTKPVTVAAALILLEQGRLLLSDPISRYLPELRAVSVGVETSDPTTGERRLSLHQAQRPPTVQDLMRHTAGFTYGQFGESLIQKAYRAAGLMDRQQTNAEMIAKLAKLPLAHQPGTAFEYGMSTDVLGRVVEVVAGRTLDEFFAAEITGPLGMTSTGFSLAAADAHRLAEPRPAAGSPKSAAGVGDPTGREKWHSGGGGLFSTGEDYSRFCRMLLNGGEWDGRRLLSRKTVDLMIHDHLPPNVAFGSFTPELGLAAPLPRLGQGYGLGIGVRTQQGLSAAPGSTGDFYWGGATGPYFWVDPVEKFTVVFMLQELDVRRRTRYRALLRDLVYQALK